MESSASVAWSSDSQCAAACSVVAGVCGVVGSHCASQSAKGGLLASSELSIVAVLTCACCGTPRGALPHGGALRCGCALAAPPCCAGAAAAAHAWTCALRSVPAASLSTEPPPSAVLTACAGSSFAATTAAPRGVQIDRALPKCQRTHSSASGLLFILPAIAASLRPHTVRPATTFTLCIAMIMLHALRHSPCAAQ